MDINLLKINHLIDYIENHLEDKLDLDSLSQEAGYSKYHLHRMFTNIVGFTVHSYIKRRKLTEASRLLIFTDKPIIEIHSRWKKQLRGDMIMNIKTIKSPKILLVGYTVNTKNGFAVIGKSMKLLKTNKEKIANPIDKDCLIALNDYSDNFMYTEKHPSFDFYAATEVSFFSMIPEGMTTKELPESKYVVFSFIANPQDSLQPVADYIYKQWFPKSTCQFNENNMYDFTKSYECADNINNSTIEYWVPIL